MAKPEFLPNGGRATLAVVGLVLVMACNAAHGALYGYRLSAWGEIDDAEPIVAIETTIGFGLLASSLFCAIAFLFWFRRAYGNTHALGLRGGYAPGWAVGGWFVPFLNLVRPAQIAFQMWGMAGKERVGSNSIVGLWWAAFLIGNFVDNIGTRMVDGSSDSMMQTGLKILIGGDGINVVGAALAIVIVRRLTAAHEAMTSLRQAEVFA